MKVYAIRHKPTGNWMPARMYRTARAGWSNWEPAETRPGYLPHDPNPRVFFTAQSARNALTMWLLGAWKRGTYQEGDWETGYYTADGDPEPHKPDAPRNRDDMEIVAGELSL